VVAWFKECKIARKSVVELLFWVGFGLTPPVSQEFAASSNETYASIAVTAKVRGSWLLGRSSVSNLSRAEGHVS
jgi:hypothetical protein